MIFFISVHQIKTEFENGSTIQGIRIIAVATNGKSSKERMSGYEANLIQENNKNDLGSIFFEK